METLQSDQHETNMRVGVEPFSRAPSLPRDCETLTRDSPPSNDFCNILHQGNS